MPRRSVLGRRKSSGGFCDGVFPVANNRVFILARRDTHDLDGVADHVSGALLSVDPVGTGSPVSGRASLGKPALIFSKHRDCHCDLYQSQHDRHTVYRDTHYCKYPFSLAHSRLHSRGGVWNAGLRSAWVSHDHPRCPAGLLTAYPLTLTHGRATSNRRGARAKMSRRSSFKLRHYPFATRRRRERIRPLEGARLPPRRARRSPDAASGCSGERDGDRRLTRARETALFDADRGSGHVRMKREHGEAYPTGTETVAAPATVNGEWTFEGH